MQPKRNTLPRPSVFGKTQPCIVFCRGCFGNHNASFTLTITFFAQEYLRKSKNIPITQVYRNMMLHFQHLVILQPLRVAAQ